jgi:hypothetical protein
MMIAGAATGGASNIGGTYFQIEGDRKRYEGERDYVNAQQQANKKQMDENRDVATKAFLEQSGAAHLQLSQSREATAAQNFDKAREARKARSTALTAGAEAGVAGNSLDSLLMDFHQQEALAFQRNNQNLLFKQQQVSSQVKGYHLEAVARTNAIKPIIPSPIQPVDYIGPALGVAKSAGQSMMSMGTGMPGKGK